MKNSIFNAVCKTRYLALLVVLILTCGNVWADTQVYSTGFENTTTNSQYQGTVTCTSAEGDGATWQIYYGNFTTDAVVSGSNCAQMRLYKDGKCGTLTQTSDIANVDSIRFAYKPSNTNVRFKVSYSTNSGSTWTDLQTGLGGGTTTEYFKYKLATRAAKFRLKITITGGHPSSSNRKLSIDDIVYKTVSSCSSPGSALAVSAAETTIYADTKTQLSTTGGNGSTVSYSVISANSTYATIDGSNKFSASRAGTYTVQASQDDNGGTCGGTATVDITVRYQVKWSVNGNDSYSTGSPTTYISSHDTKVSTLPTAPGSALCDGSKVFVGWTETQNYSNASTAPTDLFTDVAGSPSINANKTFYAVFATESNGSATYEIAGSSITGFDGGNGAYESGTYNTGDGFTIYCSKGYSTTQFRIAKSASITITSTIGDITQIVFTASETDYKLNNNNISWTGTTGTYTNSGASTITLSNTNANIARITNIAITYSGTTYSNYMTTCCENKVTLNSGSPSNGTVAFSPTGPIATCSSTASERQTTVTVTPNTGYKLTGWTKAVSGIALPDSTSAISTSSGNTAAQSNTYTFAQNANGSMSVTATFSPILVSSLKLKATQTGESDKIGDDLTMTCYPKEGQTGGNDPLNHSLNVKFHEVLPADALDKTYTWSVRVKASGAADWTNVDFNGNQLNTNAIINYYNNNTGLLKIGTNEGTAEIKITAHDGSGVSAKVTITVAKVSVTSISVDPTSMNVYAGQKKPVTITFAPLNASNKAYKTGSYSYVTIRSSGSNPFYIEGNETEVVRNETVTVTSDDGSKTATIDVTVNPLPKATFIDIVHGKTDFLVEGESVLVDGTLTSTVSADGLTVDTEWHTPTHADVSDPGAGHNTCERGHLHLVGWILKDWADANPTATHSDIVGAGATNFYGANEAIDLSSASVNGKTYYAVWAKEVTTP